MYVRLCARNMLMMTTLRCENLKAELEKLAKECRKFFFVSALFIVSLFNVFIIFLVSPFRLREKKFRRCDIIIIDVIRLQSNIPPKLAKCLHDRNPKRIGRGLTALVSKRKWR